MTMYGVDPSLACERISDESTLGLGRSWLSLCARIILPDLAARLKT